MAGKRVPTRLYQKGVITSYKRARKDLTPRQSLVKIEGVNTQEQTNFYKGKKIAFVYKCKREVKGSRFRYCYIDFGVLVFVLSSSWLLDSHSISWFS